MEIYELEDPSTGLVLEVEAESQPTNEDAWEIFKFYKEQGQQTLSGGGYKYDPQSGAKLEKEGRRQRLHELVAQSMGVPVSDVDIENGLPAVDRAKLDFLPTMSDKVEALQKKFGIANVSVLSLDANPRIVYRNPDDGKIRFVDEVGLSWSDVTSDIAGEVAPTAAAIGAGVATVGTGGVLAPALAGGAAWLGAGGLQDIAARSLAGDDIDMLEIAKRRGLEAAIQVPIDMLTMKAGGWVTGLIGKEGKDVATSEVKQLIRDGVETPDVMFRGEKSQAKALEVATQFPESKFAKKLQTEKEKMANTAYRIMSGSKQNFADEYARLTRDVAKEYQVLSDAVASTAESKQVAKQAISEAKQATSSERAKAKAQAKKIFDEKLQQQVDNLGAKSDFSPEASGQDVQSRVLDRFVQTEQESNALYGAAHKQMEGVNTTFGEFAKFLKRGSSKVEVLRDIEDEIIGEMAPPSAVRAEKVIERLDELAGEPMTFAQMNEALQMVRSRVPYGSKGLIQSGATPEQRAAYKIAKSLENLRGNMLNRASPEARKSFKRAEDFYKQRVLPYNETDLSAVLKLEEGQNLANVMKQVRRGEMPSGVRMSLGGTEVLQKALVNPRAAKDVMRASGDQLEVKRLLRQAWLHKKGLSPNQPIDASRVKLTQADVDMAKVLWDSKKVKALQRVQKFAAGKDIEVEGLSEKLFADLESAKTENAIKAWERSVKDYAQSVKNLKDFEADKIIRNIAKGEFPPPQSANMYDDLSATILDRDFKPQEIKKFVANLGGGKDGFANSVFHTLIKRSGGGRYPIDSAQLRKAGQALWDVDKMANLLRKYETRLVNSVGEKKYKALMRLNNGMRRFKSKRPATVATKDKPRANVATSLAGGISFFLTGVPNYVYNRILAALFGSDLMLSKALVRPFNSQKQLDEAIAATMKSLFVTKKGLESLMREAEKDPAFFNWLQSQLANGPMQEEAPAQ